MRNRILIYTIVLVFGLLSLSISLKYVTRTRASAPHASELLISTAALPDGWSVDLGPFSERKNLHVLKDQEAVDFAGVSFAPPKYSFASDPTAGQLVWNFGSSFDATIKFYTRFHRSSKARYQKTPNSWDYRSDVADRNRMVCRIADTVAENVTNKWTECTVITQYGEFISTFTAPIGDEYNMTLDDLKQIQAAIDEQYERAKRSSSRLSIAVSINSF